MVDKDQGKTVGHMKVRSLQYVRAGERGAAGWLQGCAGAAAGAGLPPGAPGLPAARATAQGAARRITPACGGCLLPADTPLYDLLKLF